MRIRLLSYLFFLIFLLLYTGDPISVIIAEEIKEGQAIRWSPLPGVGGYILEIQSDSGEIVEKRNTSNPIVELKLPPGNYQFRITALNKFKKIGKVYPWRDLVILPVESPIVTKSPRVFNPETMGKDFEVKGKYLHRGTVVTFKNKKGESYIAKTEVLRDGSGIKIIPPPTLPNGDWDIFYKNTRGKPFQRNLQVSRDPNITDPMISNVNENLADKQTGIWDRLITSNEDTTSKDQSLNMDKKNGKTKTNKDEDSKISSRDENIPVNNTVNNESERLPQDNNDITIDSSEEGEKRARDWNTFSIFWRQALIPGWGHYHAGYKKTGAFYFIGTLALAGGVASSARSYSVANSDYNSLGTNLILFNLIGTPDPNLDLINQTNIESSFNRASQRRIQTSNAQAALGGFYILSLIHVLITGAMADSDQAWILESFPEVYGTEVGTRYRAGYEVRF